MAVYLNMWCENFYAIESIPMERIDKYMLWKVLGFLIFIFLWKRFWRCVSCLRLMNLSEEPWNKWNTLDKERLTSWYINCRNLVSHYMQAQQHTWSDRCSCWDEFLKMQKICWLNQRWNFDFWNNWGKFKNISALFHVHEIKKEAAILFPKIQNIFHGTTIISDRWKAYPQLNGSTFYHFTLNQSKKFVRPVTGAHIQTIESSQFSHSLSESSSFFGYFCSVFFFIQPHLHIRK